MNYQIRFPIGDWSKDGHGQCDWFTISSNKSVSELREIHFKCPEVLGFDIGEICCGDNLIPFKILDLLKENNIVDNNHDYLSETIYQPSILFSLWLRILKYIDSTFEYVYQGESTIPSITFGGYDKNKRHLNNPGYGLYE